VNFTLAQYQIENTITHCQYLNRSPPKTARMGPGAKRWLAYRLETGK
jgi:hypothetical protein